MGLTNNVYTHSTAGMQHIHTVHAYVSVQYSGYATHTHILYMPMYMYSTASMQHTHTVHAYVYIQYSRYATHTHTVHAYVYVQYSRYSTCVLTLACAKRTIQRRVD